MQESNIQNISCLYNIISYKFDLCQKILILNKKFFLELYSYRRILLLSSSKYYFHIKL